MAQPLELPMFENFDLDERYVVRVTALDPTSGAVVTGVNVGAVTLMVDNLSGGSLASGSFGPFMLVPGPGA